MGVDGWIVWEQPLCKPTRERAPLRRRLAQGGCWVTGAGAASRKRRKAGPRPPWRISAVAAIRGARSSQEKSVRLRWGDSTAAALSRDGCQSALEARKEGLLGRWANAALQHMGGVSNQKSPSRGRTAPYATMRCTETRETAAHAARAMHSAAACECGEAKAAGPGRGGGERSSAWDGAQSARAPVCFCANPRAHFILESSRSCSSDAVLALCTCRPGWRASRRLFPPCPSSSAPPMTPALSTRRSAITNFHRLITRARPRYSPPLLAMPRLSAFAIKPRPARSTTRRAGSPINSAYPRSRRGTHHAFE
ncbi:hypothetical protein K491DRAFT_176349 [Lophiostoma macrostomum CBS 122681]|uniref:Uncharacterized protein n=1 Tax=Lophiostoma macrostomum CBS 122681 TaxID=1314788 RepID=A0A6A6TTY7_9PLEO|nr:hypothetical protein K491DRAFT_176349 [Lophiostoma macrostomum CBS 122681]